MANFSESALDRLWKEYASIFREWDDLTLARWLAQTLGQLEGKAWRVSHPLLGVYRLAAQAAHDRQIWFKRLSTPPAAYPESPCCRAPLLPLLSRDVLESGLVCQHCADTCVPLEEIPSAVRKEIREWAEKYGPLHAVAHWDEEQRKRAADYDQELEDAAEEVERLLGIAGRKIVPQLLEYYPAVVWEDQDECLEVKPEDIQL
jgi:hypothetical protein